jgi:S-layer protein
LGASAQNHILNLGAGDGIVTGTSTGNNVVTLASSGAVAVAGGATGSAVTVLTGNNTITDTGTKGLYVSASTGNNTVTTGSGADFITATSGNNTISTGAGIDTVSVGSGTNVVTLGAANDVFTLSAVNQSSAIFTTIADIAAGDTITLPSTVFANATGKLGAALTSVVDDYQTFLNSGASQGAGKVSWFQTGGNTYIFEDNTGGSTVFTAGADTVVKLTGLFDLSNSTVVLAGSTITIV